MPKRIRFELSAKQADELRQTRDNHPKAYLRERAAAILKVAAGQTLTAVAETGLLRRHEPETIHVWIDKYLSGGIEALFIKPGAGRKPKFFPPG